MKRAILVLLLFYGVAGQTSDLVVPVPQSGITLPHPAKEISPAPSYFEIGTSSWQPQNIQENSRLYNTTAFQKSGPSKWTFNFSAPLSVASWGLLSTKFGVSYVQLERSGSLGLDTATLNVKENMNLFQGRMALEWTTPREVVPNVRPYLDLGLAPTWLQSSASQLNEGVSENSWLAEAGAGLTWNVTPLARWLSLEEFAVDLGVETTRGLENNSLNGSGVRLGTRVGWN